jgi:hypothetical protein
MADAQEQTKVDTQLPKVNNAPLQDKMINFTGNWMPHVDGTLIGAENFQDLVNMRHTDGPIEGINGYHDFNSSAIATYTDIKGGIHFRTNRAADSYILVHARDGSNNGRVYYSTSTIAGTEGNGSFNATQLWSDASASLDGRFSLGPSGVVAYANEEESVIWSGVESNIGDVFTLANADPDNSGALPQERTEECSNQIVAEYLTMDTSDRADILILSTRPLQGIKLYVDPSNANANAANTNALTCKYWNGTSMTAVGSLSDGTAKLTTTGTLSFDSTVSVAVPKHYQERYLYAYSIGMTASSGVSSARIYQITVDMPMQAPTNVWDGIYRQPIQVQRYKNATKTYEDFTLHVQESSTVGTPVGLYLGQITASDHYIVMFEDSVSGIKHTMLGSLVNTNNAQFAAAGGVQYWDGGAWANLTFTDETLDADADTSCAQSGLIHWNPPSDEEKTTLFGTIGYAYRFVPDATFVGSADDDVVVDIVTGVPTRKAIEVYKLPALYKNKLMMCGYVQGNEGNRIDYCADNAPDVWNGDDSSMDGFQSIYVGSLEEISAATQLYNRFGSNIFSTLVILKNSEVWLMTGDSPLDYKLFPISFRIGCPAPYTLTTAEVGFNIGEQNVQRNVAMWISHQGPVMFDGAIVKPLEGIENFFDPNETDSVNYTYLKDAQAWFDSTYNEWNILIPTSGSTTLNKWLVYNVEHRKWSQKSTGTSQNIYAGISATASTGRQVIYGCADDGRLYRLEVGTSWNGGNMTFSMTTGDFFPSGNPWDITLLRRLKLVTKRSTESGATVKIFYLANTDSDSGIALTWNDVTASIANSNTAGVTFQDVTTAYSYGNGVTPVAGLAWSSASATLLDMSVDQGLNRLIRTTKALNQTNWAHAFKFEFTSASAGNLFKPIMWGYEWLPVRKEYND